MKVKDFDKVIDLMDFKCSDYCSLSDCDLALGWNEHFEATVSHYWEARRWGLYK
jgi:hypothetical protein